MASDQSIWERTRNWGAYGQQRSQAFFSGLQGTAAGRAFTKGFGEAFGQHYTSTAPGQWTSQGFLGRKGEPIRETYKTAYAAQAKRYEQGFAFRSPRSYAARSAMGGVGRMAGRAIMPAFAAFHMYEGYKQGGMTGAAKSGLVFGAEWGAFEVAKMALGSAALWGTAAVGAAGYGYYALGEASKRHARQLKHLEMGAPVADPFGTGATLRQRSLMALQNSKLNGRMSMGNEGVLIHDGAYTR